MRHLSRNLLISISIVAPTIVPATMLTSCSTTWGYNTPITFGSVFKNNAANPFYAMIASGATYYDNNGSNMMNYLQSNYSVDARTSSNYAYSAPVTKWLYDKDSQEAKEAKSQVMPLANWERNNLGWKTSSSTDYSNNASFTGTLDKDKYVTQVNNENVIQASNIDFTSSIATSLSTYFAGALKYQASQINANDLDKQEALQIAWGNGSNYGTITPAAPVYTLDNGKKGGTEQEKTKANLFYEYVFAQSNSYVTHKNHGAFLRGSNVAFNYDTFPYPTYNFETVDGVWTRIDISEATKKLLMGKNATATTKFCEAGLDDRVDLPAYFSTKTDGTLEITLGDKSGVEKVTPVNAKLEYTDYTFNNVPILVTAKGLTQRWVNPTKNDSFLAKDYYVDDQETVQSEVGKLSGIDKFADHNGDISVKEYTFDTTPSDSNNNVQAAVVGTKFVEGGDYQVDTRLVDTAGSTLNGNKFVVLATYTVREYDNDKFIYKDKSKTEPSEKYTENFLKVLEAWKTVKDSKISTDEDLIKWLTQRNMVSISSSITNIFPAYFLSMYDNLFKKAYVNAKDETIKVTGYILDADKISDHTSALLGIYNRTSTEGYKASAKELTQDSKNLLGFLTYMFGVKESETIDFMNQVVTTKGF